MQINPFQVRLKDSESPTGYRLGMVGTVVAVGPQQAQDGQVHEVCKVLWFNYDEDSGDMSTKVDAPAPSTHFPQELAGFVDELDEEDDSDYEDDEDDVQQSQPATQNLHSQTQQP